MQQKERGHGYGGGWGKEEGRETGPVNERQDPFVVYFSSLILAAELHNTAQHTHTASLLIPFNCPVLCAPFDRNALSVCRLCRALSFTLLLSHCLTDD